jgi:hypothetical protein
MPEAQMKIQLNHSLDSKTSKKGQDIFRDE